MVWYRIGDKPLSKPGMTRFIDAYNDALLTLNNLIDIGALINVSDTNKISLRGVNNGDHWSFISGL